MKMFMLDIETTGIQPEGHDLLQIGILECLWNGEFWQPGKTLEIIQFTSRSPESEFAKKEMTELYAICNKTQPISPKTIREKMLAFFHSCGAVKRNDVIFAGWNVSSFDIPFLIAKGILEAPGYKTIDGKDQEVGDYNYRIYELGGSVSITADTLKMDRKNIIDKAENCYNMGGIPMCSMNKEHDAVYDCYGQLKIMNGLIKLLRDPI